MTSRNIHITEYPYQINAQLPSVEVLALSGKGGWREVPNITSRNLILAGERVEGMMVYVQNEDKIYYLKDGLTNSCWLEWKTISNLVWQGQWGL